MLSVQIDLSNIRGLFLSDRIGDSLRRSIRSEMKHQLTEVEREARKTHRYGDSSRESKQRRQSRNYRSTGRLSKSVQTKISSDGLVGEVYLESSIAFYGIYVHEGHHLPPKYKGPGWAPDKFLDDALKKREPEIREGFDMAIRQGIRDATGI